MAYSALGSSCYLKGSLDEAESNLLKGFEYCEKANQVVWGANACFWLGQLYTEKDDYNRANDFLEKGIAIFLEQGRLFPSLNNLFKASILRVKVLSKDQDIPIGELPEFFENNRMKLFEGISAKVIGEILLNINDQHLPDAEYWIRKAIELDERNRMINFLGFDHALHAELFKRKDDKSKAKETLLKAIEILKECGADGWVKKYEEKLASLS
jgi:tetratricopeptide (TPR) repeat protein